MPRRRIFCWRGFDLNSSNSVLQCCHFKRRPTCQDTWSSRRLWIRCRRKSWIWNGKSYRMPGTTSDWLAGWETASLAPPFAHFPFFIGRNLFSGFKITSVWESASTSQHHVATIIRSRVTVWTVKLFTTLFTATTVSVITVIPRDHSRSTINLRSGTVINNQQSSTIAAIRDLFDLLSSLRASQVYSNGVRRSEVKLLSIGFSLWKSVFSLVICILLQRCWWLRWVRCSFH